MPTAEQKRGDGRSLKFLQLRYSSIPFPPANALILHFLLIFQNSQLRREDDLGDFSERSMEGWEKLQKLMQVN